MQVFPASSVLSFHFCVAMSSSTEGGGRPGNGSVYNTGQTRIPCMWQFIRDFIQCSQH